MKWMQRLAGLPKGGIIALAFLSVVLLGVADELTGSEIVFTLLYLGPIALATWFAGLLPGLLVAAAAGFEWVVADLLTGPAYSHPLIRYWNALAEIGVLLTFTLLLAKLRKHRASERALARMDPLTGVANWRSFREAAHLELERMRRYPRPLTVAYLDLDGFKAVNDEFGHGVGDALLVLVADTLRLAVRHVDMVARLGSDEFVLLLPETGSATAERLVARLREDLAQAMQRDGWPVTFSVGVVTFKNAPESVDEMIRRADRLLYAVKGEGRGDLRHEVVVN